MRRVNASRLDRLRRPHQILYEPTMARFGGLAINSKDFFAIAL